MLVMVDTETIVDMAESLRLATASVVVTSQCLGDLIAQCGDGTNDAPIRNVLLSMLVTSRHLDALETMLRATIEANVHEAHQPDPC